MSSWIGKARSNYFQVKDEAAFLAWTKTREIEVWKKVRKDGPFAGIETFSIAATTEDGSWPSYSLTEDDDIEFVNEISEHLPDNEIVILMEAGAEKLCYITGTSLAFNHLGVESLVKVDLNDIYLAAAEKFGVTVADITDCTY
jgi:hypothetical protein